MPAVFAQMDRNSVGAGCFGNLRGAHGIGMRPAARVADGGNMVDVDPETQVTAHQASPREPGLMAGMAASSGGRSSAV